MTIWAKADVSDLPHICASSFEAFGKADYHGEFGWIDHIRHERDAAIIDALDVELIEGINRAVAGSLPETLHLAWPTIYDPHTASWVKYKGFKSQAVFSDLDVRNYVAELKKHGIGSIDPALFRRP